MSSTGRAPRSRGDNELAACGGRKVREAPFPPRRLLGAEEKRAVAELFDRAAESGEPIRYGGPETQGYERELAEWLGGGHVVAVNSGTSAVLAALGGLGLEPYSEVVVPPITDPGGFMPVLFTSCVPVVADARPGSFNTGAAEIEAVLTERTRAIVVAHIGGEPVDMDPVLELAERHGLPVIEDAAQAAGARYKGKLVGSLGTASAFSTMFGKLFSTGPQGGFVFTKDEDLYWRIKRFSDRGKPFNLDAASSGQRRGPDRASTNVVLGLNLNLNDLAAAIGRAQLKKLPSIVSRRQGIARAVEEALSELEGISLGWVPPGAEPAYWWLRIQLDTDRFGTGKLAFAEAVGAEGIPVDRSYRHIPSEAVWFTERATFGTSGYPWASPLCEGDGEARYPCPNAVASVESCFNVLIHENCGEQEVSDVVAALRKVWGAYSLKQAQTNTSRSA